MLYVTTWNHIFWNMEPFYIEDFHLMDPKTSQHSTADLEAIFLWDTLEGPPKETKSCVFFTMSNFVSKMSKLQAWNKEKIQIVSLVGLFVIFRSGSLETFTRRVTNTPSTISACTMKWPIYPQDIRGYLAHLHPAGRSLNFAICDEVNRFCSHWSHWWDVFKASFSVEFLLISTNITVIPNLFLIWPM